MAIVLIQSCGDSGKDIDQLVTTNEAGVQVNSVDTLSVEDVLKLQNATSIPFLSYNAVLTPSMEKSYPFQLDSGKTVRCMITSDQDLAKVSLYKMGIRNVKLDSLTTTKIQDYILVQSGDTVSDISKKPTKYKAVVRLVKSLGGDSTVSYTLNMYKE